MTCHRRESFGSGYFRTHYAGARTYLKSTV